MSKRSTKIGLLSVLFIVLLISSSLNWRSSASPDDGEERDWWTNSAIRRAWLAIRLLNKTKLDNSTNRALNQSDSWKTLGNMLSAMLLAIRSNPIYSLIFGAPPPPPGGIDIPGFPNLDLGWLQEIPSTISVGLGVFKDILDGVLHWG